MLQSGVGRRDSGAAVQRIHHLSSATVSTHMAPSCTPADACSLRWRVLYAHACTRAVRHAQAVPGACAHCIDRVAALVLLLLLPQVYHPDKLAGPKKTKKGAAAAAPAKRTAPSGGTSPTKPSTPKRAPAPATKTD